METESPAELDAQVTGLLDLARRAATAYGREDLVPRLDRAAERYADPELTLLVVGEFKRGKSSLVNALLGTGVCPVDDDVATAVPTMVRFGEQPTAAARFEGADGLEPVELDRLRELVTEAASEDRRVTAVEVTVPRRILRGGIRIVDTPGVGGLESAHAAVTLGAMAMADAVVFVTDASQELTAPELAFLERAVDMCPTIRIALTKTDFYPAWREIAEIDRGHLERAGLEIPIHPVSIPLRSAALRLEDRGLNEESGFASLVQWILGSGAEARRLSARAAAHDVLSVTSQIRSAFVAERDGLADPAAAQELVVRLTAAQERADELKGRTARWSQTLSDGLSDLSSDIVHELRTALRTVTDEADAVLEDEDPRSIWDEYQATLETQVRDAILGVYASLGERAEAVAAAVERHFTDEERALGFTTGEVAERLADLDIKGLDEKGKQGRVASTVTALRGSYSGILMFNMLGGLLGLPAILPVTMVLGLFMGVKAMRDQKQKEVQAARQAARQSVRKYVDAASQQFGKDVQDTLRKLQRDLRDRFTDRAAEIQRSVQEALAAAKGAVDADQGARAARLGDLDAEIARLDGVVQRAAAVLEESA